MPPEGITEEQAASVEEVLPAEPETDEDPAPEPEHAEAETPETAGNISGPVPEGQGDRTAESFEEQPEGTAFAEAEEDPERGEQG